MPEAYKALQRGAALVDWERVGRVLVIRLRSIGDTVLCTPTLRVLREQLPDSRIDVLLEEWVAPLLAGHESVDSVITVGNDARARLRTALELRNTRYDVVVNLHGGTTSTFLTRASGARYRIGSSSYQFPFLYNVRLPSPQEFWGRDEVHSAEVQLAVAGHAGIEVERRPDSELPINEPASRMIDARLGAIGLSGSSIALIHPVAALFTKQWPTRSFAKIAEKLEMEGLKPVAVATESEAGVLDALRELTRSTVKTFSDLTLPEITELARRASVFVGTDSGIAHIAAAVGTPPLVIFGSSNRDHWRPWTRAPYRIVFDEYDCQPCSGYECREFGDAPCINRLSVSKVAKTLDELLDEMQLKP
ncbi:MAG: lipopolysaccharide heptosyltransferase family protein [Acidobacteria bacterium]|nr:MAG: lipopolysaccharide heptosyltransferase family protein [Acidobacteriota bacterium]REJ99192.1 MAG: lipopolysaccharide heptosyltransferase family protein [Acidobacteriota bacterium]REK16087.1 MAG: lipopolysaccharide heptosyltransferase family protein [Acidobacteriota bacterium]REK43768.1 MAG: lipopolysaccharide heptosyltransferase family protein [Acidobacteriota bacterium]